MSANTSILKNALTVILFFVFSCSEKKVEEQLSTEKQIPYYTNWIQPQLIKSLNFKDVSFPLWFNKNWISTNNISKIALKKYVSRTITNEENGSFNDSLPQLSYLFTFADAEPSKYVLGEFYDDRLVGESTFTYSRKCDSLGFNLPSFTHTAHNQKFQAMLSSLFEFVDASQPFNLVKKEEYDSLYLRYSSGNFGANALTYLLDSADWNYYEIDKVFEPKKGDVFIYGTPSYPTRSFSLHNLVEEPNTTSHFYTKNKVVSTSVFRRTKETRKRSYAYGADGLFTGYTDSTFIDSSLLFVNRMLLEYDSNRMPTRIIEQQANAYQPFVTKYTWSVVCE